MRSIFLIFIFSIYGCQLSAPSRHLSSVVASNDVLHLVFDLDWTLIATIDSEQALQSSSVLRYHNEYYRLSDGAASILEELMSHPQIRVSFFSGGAKERNEAVLRQVILSDGKSVLDKAYKVLSYDDLTPILPSEQLESTLPFTQRYRKDLTKIDHDLSRVILIDDNAQFSLNTAQERSLLWLGETYNHFEFYDQTLFQAQVEQRAYTPMSFDQWWSSRKKIYLIPEIIEQAFINPADMSLREKIQWEAQKIGLQENKINHLMEQALIKRGVLRTQAMPSCMDSMSALLMGL